MTVTEIKRKLTQRGRRHLERRAPKLIENDKQLLLLRSQTANNNVFTFLRQVAALKQPLCQLLSGRRPASEMQPFDNPLPLERLCQKMDTSLFAIGSHSRKRPDNVVVGRLFDGHVLDMFELGIGSPSGGDGDGDHADSGAPVWRPMVAKKCSVPLGTKPVLLFCGSRFDTDARYIRLKSVLADLFRGVNVDAVRLTGLELVLQFIAPETDNDTNNSSSGDKNGAPDTILWRTYRAHVSGAGVSGVAASPGVRLEEVGPSATLHVRRSQLGSADMMKRALRRPKQISAQNKRAKNVSDDKLGAQLGRVHMVPQDLRRLTTKKLKGLKPLPKKRQAKDTSNPRKKLKS